MKSKSQHSTHGCVADSVIEKGYGFCECDDGHKAKQIQDGTCWVAEVALCYCHQSSDKPSFMNYLCLGKDDLPYLSYDFLITDHDDPFRWIRKIIRFVDEDASDGSWSYSDEYRQLIDAAANTFSWDRSEKAEDLRANPVYEQITGMYFVTQTFVPIEIGLDSKTGYNYVKHIIGPDDPRYIEMMGLGGVALPGTGIDGKHQPPPRVCNAG
jgi:hypothetical protein